MTNFTNLSWTRFKFKIIKKKYRELVTFIIYKFTLKL